MDLWVEGRQRWSDRDLVIASALPAEIVMDRIRGGHSGHTDHAASRVDEQIDHAHVVTGWAGHDWFRVYAHRRRIGTGTTRLATGTVHDNPSGGCILHATFWITQFGRAALTRMLVAAGGLAVVLFLLGSVFPQALTLLYGWLGLVALVMAGLSLSDRMSRRNELTLEHWLRFCTDSSNATAPAEYS